MLLLSCLLVVGGNSIHGSFGGAFVDRQAPPLMHIGSRSLQPPMKLVENDFPAHVTGTLRCACNAVLLLRLKRCFGPRVCSSAEPGTKGSLYAKHLSSEVQIRHWSVRFEAQPVCTELYRIGARRNEWAVHGCTTALSVHFTEKWAISRQTDDREASFYRPRHVLDRVRPDQSRWFWSPTA